MNNSTSIKRLKKLATDIAHGGTHDNVILAASSAAPATFGELLSTPSVRELVDYLVNKYGDLEQELAREMFYSAYTAAFYAARQQHTY